MKIPKSFYSLTFNDIVSNYGGGVLLHLFNNSPQEFVVATNPQLNWIEWLFKGNRKWKDFENHKRYFEWMGKELGFSCLRAWDGLTMSHVRKMNGTTLIREYYNSSMKAFVQLHLGNLWEQMGAKESQDWVRECVDGLFCRWKVHKKAVVM